MAARDQRHMVDSQILDKVVDSANLSSSDVVLEVGAGYGYLTEKIAEKSKVTAYEYDRRLMPFLEKSLKDEPNATLVCDDALKADFPIYNKIVSNIPYSDSRKLLERFITEGFQLAVLVVQREFAEKLNAGPGSPNYRMLSVLVQTTCELEVLFHIPARAFRPQPEVESVCIRLRQLWRPPKDYITFLNTLFSQKNKRLRNILDVPEGYGILRPSNIPAEKMRQLYLAFG